MKKLVVLTFSICILVIVANAQINLTRYQIGGNIPNGQELNPAYFPNANFYFSWPGISNVAVDINAPISYNDLFEVTGDSVRINLENYLNDEKNDFLSMDTTIPIIGFGFRLDSASRVSFFANSKTTLAFGIPKDLGRWVYNGNGQYIGNEYEVDDLGFRSMSYVEVGMQYARDLTIAGREFTGGVRLKYLAGIGYAGLNSDSKVNIFTENNTYRTTFNFENARLRTAGIDIDDDDNIDEGIAEGDLGGSGFAIDLGGQWQFNEKLNFNFAANDIGYISWKNASKEIRLIDESFVFDGANVESDDFGAEIETEFEEAYDRDTLDATFNTMLNPSIYMGASYKVGKYGYVSTTWGYGFKLGKMRNSFGIGYTQNFRNLLSVSTTLSRSPQQPIDLGVALGLRLGFWHFHAFSDGLLRYIDLTNAKRVNVGFGLTWSFGYPNGIFRKALPEDIDRSQEIRVDKGKKFKE